MQLRCSEFHTSSPLACHPHPDQADDRQDSASDGDRAAANWHGPASPLPAVAIGLAPERMTKPPQRRLYLLYALAACLVATLGMRARAATEPLLVCAFPLRRHLDTGTVNTYQVSVAAGSRLRIDVADITGSIGPLRLSGAGQETCSGTLQLAGPTIAAISVAARNGSAAGHRCRARPGAHRPMLERRRQRQQQRDRRQGAGGHQRRDPRLPLTRGRQNVRPYAAGNRSRMSEGVRDLARVNHVRPQSIAVEWQLKGTADDQTADGIDFEP